MTERFYRGDTSRGTPGVELGLSLVAAVARLHGGSLKLSDNHPGLRATLILVPMAMPRKPAPAHVLSEHGVRTPQQLRDREVAPL